LKKILKRPKNRSKGARRDRTERLQVLLPAEELAAIDEFRFQAWMPSRAAAVRELLRRGLIASGELKKGPESRNNA
jgi:metal-responsive CopG/Arc/MetJ family transcriptional regulator